MSRETVALALEWVEVVSGDDLDRALAMTHPDLKFALPRHEIEGGCERGHDGLRRAWQRTAETWERIQIEIEELRDAGDCVVALGRGSNRMHDGHEIEYRTAGLIRVGDGKIIESRSVSQDLDAPFEWAGIRPSEDDVFARLRRSYAAFNVGDIGGAMEVFDDAIEWNPAADFIDRGRLHGREAVEQHLRGLHELWDDLRLEPQTLIQVEETMIVNFRQTATGGLSGVDVAAEGWHVWQVRDGLVVRQHTFRERADAFRTAGLPVLSSVDE